VRNVGAAEGGTVTIAEILNAVAIGSGRLPPAQFGDMTIEELRAAIAELNRRAAQHDQRAQEHQNAARLCRVGAASVDAALGLREVKAA
jgi:hypothetical protein